MSKEYSFLAIDLGAESGRGIIITLKNGKLELEEIHRFANRPVNMGGTLYWDIPFLFAEIQEALKICVRKGASIDSIGVDTWGVDFGLLGSDDKLVGLPVHYRDVRTNGIHDYSNPTMSEQEIFELTGYEPWQISSLFQLLSMKRDSNPQLDMAKTFLNIPDLLNYFLTGIKANERSILNTSNLMDTQGEYCKPIIEKFQLPDMFSKCIEPATVLGDLSEQVAAKTGMKQVPVVAVCGHDTSAALAAVPADIDNWAFLSCGTWSILGRLVDTPVATADCLAKGFTNEYTVGGWYLARNILGLWLLQELKRKWDDPANPLGYDQLEKEARAVDPADFDLMIDAADQTLMAPADMEVALCDLLNQTGQKAPANRGELVLCVLESLALEYDRRIKSMAEVSGQMPEALYIVGGGIKNRLLCQLTANACGLPVHAGVDQCTAVGNALCQAMAVGAIESTQEMRKIAGDSFEMNTYQPQDQDRWDKLREKYALITG